MSSFKELGVKSKYIELLKRKGISVPTAIQNETISLINEGKDIIGESATGTGKTLAFLLPTLEKLEKESKDSWIKVLILAPTRELTIQIGEVIEGLDVEGNFKLGLIYGGKTGGRTKKELDIVVATPGRLLELIEKKIIDISKISTLIIDEADQMILLGFKNEVEKIIKNINKKHQTLCFSATLNSEVKKFAYRYTKEPKVINVKEEIESVDNISQFIIETSDRRKIDSLCTVLNEDNPFIGIIFCRTKVRVDKLDEQLHTRGYSCQKLHSDIPQSKREKILKSFKNLEVQYLIATDVVARGIDIQGVTHIYNYDIPEGAEGYIHRIGRTGRAKEKGTACLFIDDKDREKLKVIESELGYELKKREVFEKPNTENTNILPKTKYDKRINVSSKKIENIKIVKKREALKRFDV